MQAFFASTAQGLEELLKKELHAQGVQVSRVVHGGVYFSADLTLLYQCLLWSHLASRIVLPLAELKVTDAQDLYNGCMQINWSLLFSSDKTFSVHFNGTNAFIRHRHFGALTVKDAIVDHFMQAGLSRPNSNKEKSDITIQVILQREIATVALDLSGTSLHQRGYRHATGIAPLKETLAAAIVMRSGWRIGTPLIDPMCGSGTLLIEAALQATDTAPALLRKEWGFLAWSGHQPLVWQQVLDSAIERKESRKRSISVTPLLFYGFDISQQSILDAQQNAQRAGVSDVICWQCQDVLQLRNPFPKDVIGTIISNPPYGERLAHESTLVSLHTGLADRVKEQFPGWSLSLFSASPNLLNSLQLRAHRQFAAKNGVLDCIQKNYFLSSNEHKPVSIERAVDFANRLRKNIKKFTKWAEKEHIECYRIYDADLPDYNLAIDRYGSYVVVQEYAPPATVDPSKAKQRLLDSIAVITEVLSLSSAQCILKTRARQKGKQQYRKLASKGDFIQVKEYAAIFWVNLIDYLDTGLFLDHRIARKQLGNLAKGKDFLNLFAYTATATVHAGLGGAQTTTSVDMSHTYLDWAERNLQLNGLIGDKHRLIQADCLSWLIQTDEQFDLIFLDPPTFSNSKRMNTTFDVQRDHLWLLQHTKRLLRPGGVIMFSNNKQQFKLDALAVKQLGFIIDDITDKTTSLDFSRHQSTRHCFLLKNIFLED